MIAIPREFAAGAIGGEGDACRERVEAHSSIDII